MAATGLSRWQSQWAERAMWALQHFVMTTFTFQVFSFSAKDCLRNENFRTKLVNITGLSKIWLYQMLKKVYANNMVEKKVRLTAINYWKMADSNFEIFLKKTTLYFFKDFSDLKYGRHRKNLFLLKFYWLYKSCFLQILSCLFYIFISI